MNKKYLGYTLLKSEIGYRVRTPYGNTLGEVAANLKTACKWVEAHIAEVRRTPGNYPKTK